MSLRKFELIWFILIPLLVSPGACWSAQVSAAKVNLLNEKCPEEFNIRGKVFGLKSDRSSAEIFFHHVDSSNFLSVEFTPGRVTVTRRKNGGASRLASEDFAEAPDGSLNFTIKRRLWRITLICNDRIIARAYDSEMSGGDIGWSATRGATVDGLRLQEKAPIYFTDDFTRSAGELGQWEILSGKCGISEVAMGNHGGVAGRHSSNAFSWAVHADPLALCSTGHWFWDDYAAEACVKPEDQSGTGQQDRGAIGIVAYLKDSRNYFLFRWTAGAPGRPASGAKELLRVQNGEATVLDSQPGGYQPREWYRLRFIVRDGALSGYIDGRLVCSAHDESFGQGKVGLYAERRRNVTFDDVRVVSADGLHEEFTQLAPGKWENVGLTWRTEPRLRSRVAPMDRGEGMTVTGRSDWDNYSFAADVTPKHTDDVGLVFAHHDSRSHDLFVVPVTNRAKARLVRVSNGKRTVLAESLAPVAVTGKARLKVAVSRGRIKAFIDDRLTAETVDPLTEKGRIGLYTNGSAGARFSNVTVWFAIEEPNKPRIEEQFTQEETMSGWASARGSWKPGEGGVFWHSGDFYGDPKISVALPAGRAAFSGLLVVNSDGVSVETGYQLLAQIDADGQAKLELKRRGEKVASSVGKWTGDADSRQLRLWREGGFIAGELGDAVAVSYQDNQPLTGTKVGVRRIDGELALAAVDATTTHVVDCTFSGPPTEWWSERGVWDVAQRWPCDNRWSFFGGLNSESPMLWTRHSYSGDLTVEAWVALYMDYPEDQRTGYRHPSDLNLSFCANGKDVSSGYSFMFAAANNTVSRIMRREQVVAETDNVKMINPVRLNLAFQRHWFYLRAEKRGNQIRFFVDGQPVGTFTDPHPLTGGQVALWSWRNGLMVARARIWYQKDEGYRDMPALKVIPAPQTPAVWKVSDKSPVTLISDFAHGTDGWSALPSEEAPVLALDRNTHVQGARSLRVVNRVSGGDMTVYCGIKQFDAVKFPFLQFNYKLGGNVKVNVYLRVHQQWMVLGFSAPMLPGEDVTSLGPIADVKADDQWHTAQIDLLSALRKHYPNDASVLVEDLCFASPRVEYLRSGFGGNYWGVEYSLSNFRLVGAKTTPSEDAKRVVMRTVTGNRG